MSIIYKIYCKDENIKECYVGSTNDLKKRKYTHKYSCNNINSHSYNFKVYAFIRANGGWNNFDFIILEQFENKMIKKDLLKIERKYIETNDYNLNSELPSRTSEEWCKNNKIRIAEKSKKYQQDNKIRIAEKSKKYQQDNKIELTEKRKIYYEKNKIEINEKNRQKIECEFCNSLVSKGNIKEHQKSKKCIKAQNT